MGGTSRSRGVDGEERARGELLVLWDRVVGGEFRLGDAVGWRRIIS